MTSPASFERANSLLKYDAETGVFVWRQRRGARFAPGSVAGTIGLGGYVVIGIDRKYYKAHRLAFLLTYGEWPADVVDHINGVKTDNRLANLRVVSQAQNSRNQSASKSNSSGFKGVHWHKRKQAWVASIRVDRTLKHLGYFQDKKLAALAYDVASEKYHGEFGRPSTAMLHDKQERVDA